MAHPAAATPTRKRINKTPSKHVSCCLVRSAQERERKHAKPCEQAGPKLVDSRASSKASIILSYDMVRALKSPLLIP